MIEAELWQKQDKGLIGVVPVLETDPSMIPENALMLIANTLGPNQAVAPPSERDDESRERKTPKDDVRPEVKIQKYFVLDFFCCSSISSRFQSPELHVSMK
jgi:hypothetical protein